MAGLITAESLQRVKDATDIHDVISGYVSLKRSGKGYMGLCPFHDEKTPSFSVTPDRGWFNCFGCGEKGSAIDFVMAMDRVDFVEAVEFLAERAGVTIEREEGKGPVGPSQASTKADVFRVNRWACEFFKRRILKAEGEACRGYLLDRGFTDETREAFEIGYAPDAWTELADAAKRKGIPEQLLLDAGLARKRDGKTGVYDAFRDRLIFPIVDALNRVIGFGGRCLDGSEPKYLNSPQTTVFNKSASLYGLDRLKSLRDQEEIFVMEGYTDVIMAVQAAGMPAVATLGTALTPQHARLLSRYSDRITLVYDGDSAGRKAAERGAELFTAVDLDVRVARLEGGQDPCEFLLARGEKGREEIAGGAMAFFDFVLGEVKLRHDVEAFTGKVKAADELLGLARSAANPIKRGLILDRISDALGLARSDLDARLADTQPRGRRDDGETAPRPRPQVREEPDRPVTKATRRAERHIFEAIINGAGENFPWHQELRVEDFSTGFFRRLFERLRTLKEAGPVPRADDLLMHIEDEAERVQFKDLVLPEGEADRLAKQIAGAARHLLERRHDRELEAMKAEGVNDDNFADIVEKMRRKPISKDESPPGGKEPKPAFEPPTDAGPQRERTWEPEEGPLDALDEAPSDDGDDMF